MATPAQTNKSITIDVNAESYGKGYEDASAECAKQDRETWVSYGQKQFISTIEGWIPVILLLGLVILWSKRRWRTYDAMNLAIVERQKQSLELIAKTNMLLAEISKKLDSK